MEGLADNLIEFSSEERQWFVYRQPKKGC